MAGSVCSWGVVSHFGHVAGFAVTGLVAKACIEMVVNLSSSNEVLLSVIFRVGFWTHALAGVPHGPVSLESQRKLHAVCCKLLRV